MKPLGRRDHYGPIRGTLGASCHSDFHGCVLLAVEKERERSGLFALERTTERGDPLPAGPETAPWLQVSGHRWQSRDFPRPRVADAIDAASQPWADIQRVIAALGTLQGYEPHGGLLAQTVYRLCIKGTVRLDLGRGWRHADLGAVVGSLYGSADQAQEGLRRAWAVLAVLVVDAETLAAARAVEGAVDPKAWAWATGRGLRPSPQRPS